MRLAVAAVVLGCLAGCGDTRQPTATPAAPVQSLASPTKEEVVEYLRGRPLTLPAGQPTVAGKADAFKLDAITAVEIETGSFRINNEYWHTPVAVIGSAGADRYALRLVVKHQLIDGKRAFFGVEVKDVAKQ